jgi:hypothetical protein
MSAYRDRFFVPASHLNLFQVVVGIEEWASSEPNTARKLQPSWCGDAARWLQQALFTSRVYAYFIYGDFGLKRIPSGVWGSSERWRDAIHARWIPLPTSEADFVVCLPLVHEQDLISLFRAKTVTARAPEFLLGSPREETAACHGFQGENMADQSYVPPYVGFALRASAELRLSANQRVTVKEIKDWLKMHWPKELGPYTERKAGLIATFVRDPTFEKGGNFRPRRSTCGDDG